MDIEKIKKFFETKKFEKIILVVSIFILALVIFQLGVFVGFHKASFSNRWGENYRETFGGKHGGMMRMMWRDDDYSTAHGAVGKIIKLELPKIIMIGSDNVEKVVVLKNDTVVLSSRDKISATDLKVDDYIVTIGSPNNLGEVEAKLIRVMPTLMMNTTTTTPKK